MKVSSEVEKLLVDLPVVGPVSHSAEERKLRRLRHLQPSGTPETKAFPHLSKHLSLVEEKQEKKNRKLVAYQQAIDEQNTDFIGELFSTSSWNEFSSY